MQCVIAHRGHGDHVPHCMREMVNRKVASLAALRRAAVLPLLVWIALTGSALIDRGDRAAAIVMADGIELRWGNHQSMIAMLEKLALREGFGDVLADGVQRAAEQIGKGSDEYAVHIQGQQSIIISPENDPQAADHPKKQSPEATTAQSLFQKNSAVNTCYPRHQGKNDAGVQGIGVAK